MLLIGKKMFGNRNGLDRRADNADARIMRRFEVLWLHANGKSVSEIVPLNTAREN